MFVFFEAPICAGPWRCTQAVWWDVVKSWIRLTYLTILNPSIGVYICMVKLYMPIFCSYRKFLMLKRISTMGWMTIITYHATYTYTMFDQGTQAWKFQCLFLPEPTCRNWNGELKQEKKHTWPLEVLKCMIPWWSDCWKCVYHCLSTII